MLNNQVESFVKMLYPHAKAIGNYMHLGSVNGESGDSLKVYLSGDKQGKWVDYASDGDKGDLIDLWFRRYGVDKYMDGFNDIKAYLGIPDKEELKPAKKINLAGSFSKFEQLSDKMRNYLTSRHLSEDTIKAFRLSKNNGSIVFPYFHGDEVKMWKVLTPGAPKNTWTMSSGDKELCLFGWQAIKSTDREVVITEGEIDAMSYHEQGIPALSVPNGGGSGKVDVFIESEHKRLMDHFDVFYISMDMDDTGQRMVPGLVERLGSANCRIVNLPDIPNKKSDANECLKQGIELDYYIKTSKYPDVKGVINIKEAFSDAMAIFRGDISVTGKPLPWEEYEDKFGFRPCEVTMWGGYNGSGKSMLITHIMNHLGKLDDKSIYASLEMTKGRTAHRAMRQANSGYKPSDEYAAAVMDNMSKSMWLIDNQKSIKPDEMLEKLEYSIARYGIKHVTIDPLAKCVQREDDWSGQKEFVEKLTDFAHETKVHVNLVVHAKKGENATNRIDKMSIKGSGGMVDMTDNLFILQKNIKKYMIIELIEKGVLDPNSKDDDVVKKLKVLKQGDYYLNCEKQRNGEWEGSIPLWFDKQTFQFLSSEGSKPFKYTNWSRLE
jgi:twinkle protein